MDLLRITLVRLRKQFDKDKKKYFTTSIALTFLFILIDTLVDYFLPFTGPSNILRSVILVPAACCIYTILYGISLIFHYNKVKTDEEWTPYRLRYSASWRLRISLIVVAFLLVIILSMPRQVGYSLASSVLAAIFIVLIAFLRPTIAEAERAELGIPDARDVDFETFRKVRAQDRENKSKKANDRLKKAEKAKE